MKTIIIALITFIFISCGNNQNSDTSNSESTIVGPDTTTASSDTIITSLGSTDTTGTGTISDSGNAANNATLNKIDSTGNPTRTTSLNGTDTVSR